MYAIMELQKKITNREIDAGHARWRAWQRRYRELGAAAALQPTTDGGEPASAVARHPAG
jgi:hypothetical protein